VILVKPAIDRITFHSQSFVCCCTVTSAVDDDDLSDEKVHIIMSTMARDKSLRDGNTGK